MEILKTDKTEVYLETVTSIKLLKSNENPHHVENRI